MLACARRNFMAISPPTNINLHFRSNDIEKNMLEISESFADTRSQLHWASQLLSAAADAKLEKAEDDSHSNLGWNSATNSLEGRAGVSLNVNEFAIDVDEQSLSLAGKTLKEAAVWLGQQLGVEVEFRDYEMPEHAVGKGQPFSPNTTDLEAISQWFTFGVESLSGNGELRVWPHHFDLGFWNATESEGKSIGGGFTLGDHYYDQPYFYINPYGIDKPESLPQLAHGTWTEHWFGAVLTASELGDDPAHTAKHFVTHAIEMSIGLLE